jgi:hypothetical protein
MEIVGTYRFLGDFPNILSYSYTLWVFFKELLGGGGVHIMYEECVLCWYLRSEISGHGVA